MNYLMDAAVSYLLTATVITVIIFLAEYGLFLIVPFILIGDAIAWIYKKVKTFLDELLNQELAEYEAKEFNVILETWKIDPKNGKKFIKTAAYK